MRTREYTQQLRSEINKALGRLNEITGISEENRKPVSRNTG